MGVGELTELFDALDIEKSGFLGIEFFCESIWQVIRSNKPLGAVKMERQVSCMHSQLIENHKVRVRTQAALDDVHQELASVKVIMKDTLQHLLRFMDTLQGAEVKKSADVSRLRPTNRSHAGGAGFDPTESRRGSKESVATQMTTNGALGYNGKLDQESLRQNGKLDQDSKRLKSPPLSDELPQFDTPAWAAELIAEMLRLRTEGLQLISQPSHFSPDTLVHSTFNGSSNGHKPEAHSSRIPLRSECFIPQENQTVSPKRSYERIISENNTSISPVSPDWRNGTQLCAQASTQRKDRKWS